MANTGTAEGRYFDIEVEEVVDPYIPVDDIQGAVDRRLLPEPGRRYVAVELLITNTGDERHLFDAWESQAPVVLDTQERQWRPSGGGYWLEELDRDTRLGAGEEAQGWLTFEVSKDSDDLSLRLELPSSDEVVVLDLPAASGGTAG